MPSPRRPLASTALRASLVGATLSCALACGSDNAPEPEAHASRSTTADPSGSSSAGGEVMGGSERTAPAEATDPSARGPDTPAPATEEARMTDDDPSPAAPESYEPFAEVPPPRAATLRRQDAATFAAATNALAADLYETLRGRESNLAYSPAGIEIAFAMAAAGARGATAEEMHRVLHIDAPQRFHRAAGQTLAAMNASRRLTLRVVNRLFGERSYRFEPDFLTLTREVYRAPLEPVDFVHAAEPTRARINAWVAQQTGDRIRELLPPRSLDGLTRLVLVDAVHFLARWEHPFDAAGTQPGFFYVDGRERVTVSTMNQSETFAYAEDDDAQILQLPYEGGEATMLVLLPRERDGLPALEQELSVASLEARIAALRPTQVAVSLPRFSVGGARLDLAETMRALGMRLAFDRNGADFTGMANPPEPSERLYLTRAVHQARVDVDEQGTEAAAATAVVGSLRGAALRRPVEFVADHPLLFLIRHEPSGAWLFVGRLVDPRS